MLSEGTVREIRIHSNFVISIREFTDTVYKHVVMFSNL